MGGLRILVLQARGRVGRELLAHLKKAKEAGREVFVRAACRKVDEQAEYLKKLGADEVVCFDYDNAETFAPALEGMTQLFAANPDPQADGYGKFCEAVAKYGKIQHAVRLSCFGADTVTASYDEKVHASLDGVEVPGMLKGYWRDERVLLEALPKLCTMLRGNFFQGHIVKPETGNIDEKGVFRSPLGECKNSFVSTNDIGEAAAVCLLEGVERHGNKFYDLTGPIPQSMHDVAKDLSEALGKPVKYEAQDIDQFEKDFGPQRRAFFEYLRNGFYTRCSPDFYNLTGKKPQAFIEYLKSPGAAGETGLEEMWKAGMWSKGKNVMAGHKA